MGEAKRRKETGAPPPNRKKDRKSLYIGISVIVLVFVAVGVFFLTASPAPTSDELPAAGMPTRFLPNWIVSASPLVTKTHPWWCGSSQTTSALPARVFRTPASS